MTLTLVLLDLAMTVKKTLMTILTMCLAKQYLFTLVICNLSSLVFTIQVMKKMQTTSLECTMHVTKYLEIQT